MVLIPPSGEILGHSIASPLSAKKLGFALGLKTFARPSLGFYALLLPTTFSRVTRRPRDKLWALFPPFPSENLTPSSLLLPKKVSAGGDFAKPARLPKSQILNLTVFPHPLAYQLFQSPYQPRNSQSKQPLLIHPQPYGTNRRPESDALRWRRIGRPCLLSSLVL